jgi:hypothetical protein
MEQSQLGSKKHKRAITGASSFFDAGAHHMVVGNDVAGLILRHVIKIWP